MTQSRIVVVGCGSIGRRHARLLSKRSDVRVELCEPDRDNLTCALREVGEVTTHDSFQQMIATRPEMVVIATPHAMHAEQAIQSLLMGTHVLCEKPMSDTLANGRLIVDTVEKTGRVLSVGFTNHFNPALRQIKQMIEEKQFGSLLHVHFHVGTYVTLSNSVSRYQAKTEGALFMDYAHQPDLLYWWLGQLPISVFAAGRRGGKLPLQSNPNVAAITLEYADGLLATIHLNYVQHPGRAGCEVIGDTSWALLDLRSGLLRIGQHDREVETEQHFTVEPDELYMAEHQAFFDAIAGKREPESPAREAIASTQIIDAAMRSWKQQQRIDI